LPRGSQRGEGVSNEVFPNKREAVEGCVFNPLPEDSSDWRTRHRRERMPARPWNVSEMSSDAVNFAAFVRLLAPPKPAPRTPSAENGANCFIRRLRSVPLPGVTTSASTYGSLSGVTYHPYSDFALHLWGRVWRMGCAGSAERISSAPLRCGVLGSGCFFCMTGGRRLAGSD